MLDFAGYMGETVASPRCAKKMVDGVVLPQSVCTLECADAQNPGKVHRSTRQAYCECLDNEASNSRVCSWGVRIKGKTVPIDSQIKPGEYVLPILFGTDGRKCHGVTY